MISDASHSHYTRCAGLGVIDLYTGKKYSHSISNIENSSVAEYRALCLSVQIAINNGYDNVVFVYDNRELNLDSLKLWLTGKIYSFQFLWLKRAYVKDADKIAKKARDLQEKILKSTPSKLIIDDSNLLQAFKSYSVKQIVRAFISIAEKNDAKILRLFVNDKTYSLTKITKESIEFHLDIYHLITKEKDKKRFLKLIRENYSGTIEIEKLQTPKSDEYYLDIIKSIIDKLNSRKLLIQKREEESLESFSKEERAQRVITKLQKRSYQEIARYSIKRAKGSNKKFLRAHFDSSKTQAYKMSKEDIELYLFIHHLLPEKHKEPFFGFIRNKLKRDKKLRDLFYVRDEEFYLNYL